MNLHEVELLVRKWQAFQAVICRMFDAQVILYISGTTYKFACTHVMRAARSGSISSRSGCRGTMSKPVDVQLP